MAFSQSSGFIRCISSSIRHRTGRHHSLNMFSTSTNTVFTIDTPERMSRLGAILASDPKPGLCLCLFGGMGTGKTLIASGFIRHCCENEKLRVSSPTYLLSQTYDSGKGIEIHHMDLQRLASQSDLTSLNLHHIFKNEISIIEWPDRLGTELPTNRIDVQLVIKPLTDERYVEVTSHGDERFKGIVENVIDEFIDAR